MAGSGGVLPPIGPGATFNSFMVYLQAALNGDGIALGWRGLLDDALTAGRLRVVTRHSVKSDLGYYACLTESGAARAGAVTFLDWVGAGRPVSPLKGGRQPELRHHRRRGAGPARAGRFPGGPSP